MANPARALHGAARTAHNQRGRPRAPPGKHLVKFVDEATITVTATNPNGDTEMATVEVTVVTDGGGEPVDPDPTDPTDPVDTTRLLMTGGGCTSAPGALVGEQSHDLYSRTALARNPVARVIAASRTGPTCPGADPQWV